MSQEDRNPSVFRDHKISFNYESRQTTGVLIVPMPLSLIEITDVLISHHSCSRDLKITFTLFTALQ